MRQNFPQDAYASLLSRLAGGQSCSESVSHAGVGTLAAIAVDLLQKEQSAVIVLPDRASLLTMRGLISLLSPELSASPSSSKGLFFGDLLCLPPCTPRSIDRAGWAARLSSLYALKNGRTEKTEYEAESLRPIRGVIMTADNILLRLPPLHFFEGQRLSLAKGEEIPPAMLIEQLAEWGYERVPMVANTGEFALRGDILDIFAAGRDNPFRLDFFGDVLEEIRIFDASTQRSQHTLQEITILPLSPLSVTAPAAKAIQSRWKRLEQKGLLTEAEHAGLRRLFEERSLSLLPGAAWDSATDIEEWLPGSAVWLLPGKNDLEDALTLAESQWKEALADPSFHNLPARLALRKPEDALCHLKRARTLNAEPLKIGIAAQGLELAERELASFQSLFPSAAEQDRPWQTLIHALKNWQEEKKQVILSFASPRSREKFIKLAEQDNISPSLRLAPHQPGLFAVLSPFRGGRELLWDNALLLGEDIIQPNAARSRHVPTGAFKGLDRYDGLTPGELLVHRDYGIARFGGLQRMDVGGAANDYLLLDYAGDDRLYVPVDRIALVQRYKGGSELAPALDRLGGNAWQAGKEKARKAIEKIAADLVEMYAWRKVAKGFRYAPAGELYREFEATFGFEETPDQAKAIRDMLEDMERPEPMDRLICGDVGFGKTEVALRAAFRAASEGRQVALLCPTTVLAEQYYQTFRSRLSAFALNVGLLSRFVSAKQQKEVLKAAAAGQIDVLVGTHRLLSK
ncbi:MAG: DEAD/DEAH box helicase, partial [Desulfovibrionaceae bacterium]|nr:DEAD/DEAH box helicase [Desulfovibrionaceae bacterium]